jgi:hypothetical protein
MVLVKEAVDVKEGVNDGIGEGVGSSVYGSER